MSSPRTAERLARILAMVPWVVAHPGAEVAEVCRRFGYTRSELARDLDLIFLCGLPGYAPGDLIDASLDGDEVEIRMADYFSRPQALTPVESLVLLAAGLAVLSAGTEDGALRSGVDKLAHALLPEPGVIDVDVAPETEADTLGLLRRSAAQGAVIQIEYTAVGSGATTTRQVEPWRVFTTMGNWYLSGHCRMARGERVFRVDRIRSARETGESFTPPSRLPPAEVRYTPGADDTVVRLALTQAARWVMDYYPVRQCEAPDDELVVEFSASDPKVVARLLVRLGSSARLLDGGDAEAVRSATAELRSRILDRYR